MSNIPHHTVYKKSQINYPGMVQGKLLEVQEKLNSKRWILYNKIKHSCQNQKQNQEDLELDPKQKYKKLNQSGIYLGRILSNNIKDLKNKPWWNRSKIN